MVIDETIEAYADCNCLADGPRDLDFRGQWVDWPTCFQALWHAIEGGYNDFTPNRLKRRLEGLDWPPTRWRHGIKLEGSVADQDLKFQPAREGSVCLYIRGDGIRRIAEDGVGADEVSIEGAVTTHWVHATDLDELEIDNYTLRLWWD